MRDFDPMQNAEEECGIRKFTPMQNAEEECGIREKRGEASWRWVPGAELSGEDGEAVSAFRIPLLHSALARSPESRIPLLHSASA
jgi:hypothetical protein